MTHPHHTENARYSTLAEDAIAMLALVLIIGMVAMLPSIMADPTVSLTAPAEASE